MNIVRACVCVTLCPELATFGGADASKARFDLIVMARTASLPPDPALYKALFFVPLLLIEITTFWLLTLGQGDVSWTVLADPEGNEFDVLTPR
jgi:hypothetical protein